jgi:hypothetical protein
MMTPKDFEKLICQTDATGGDTIRITYKDGSIVEGFVQRIDYNFSPAFVNVCKSLTKRGENSDHQVDFLNVKQLEIIDYNGGIKEFK